MLNRDGYKVLFNMRAGTRRTACFLLAFYDLRRFQVIELGRRRNSPWTVNGTFQAIARLVRYGFLEYGGQIANLHRGDELVRMVRIPPKLLLTPADIKAGTWRLQAQQERTALLKRKQLKLPKEFTRGA